MTTGTNTTDCEEPRTDVPQHPCGASRLPGTDRCLAHAGDQVRDDYLNGLVPGADIDMRKVPFTGNLLARLLDAVRDPQTDTRPHLGTAYFRGATFSGSTGFSEATFSGYAGFDEATFSGNAHFDGVTFSGEVGFEAVTFSRDVTFKAASFSGAAGLNLATFSGAADFGGAAFSGYAGFLTATFSGAAAFDGVTFSGNAGFDGTTFSGDADFNGANFSGHTGFNEATFSGDTHFIGVTFSKNVGFNTATFSGNAAFNSVTFSGPARFSGATFSRNAHFRAATFSGRADFTGARFASDVTWLCQAETLVLNDAVAEGDLQAEMAVGEVSASRLRSSGRVSLRLRSARVDLSGLVCAGPVSVHALAQPIAAAPDPHGSAAVVVTSLRGVDAGSLTLTDVDLSECVFAGLHRADQIQLDGRCTFAGGRGGRRRVLAEEHHWRAARRTERRGDPGSWHAAPREVEMVGPARIEVIYRQLRKALEEGKNEPGAADFYYGEMEMRRARARGADRVLVWLYWAVSGYGLRARRALAWVALVAALSIAGMTVFGFPQTARTQQATGTITTPAGRQAVSLTIEQSGPVIPLSQRLEKAAEVTVNAVIFRNPDAELTTPGRYLNIAVRILGPILLGLAILAIRNQVKR